MSKRLRALLIVVGTVSAGSLFTFFRADPDTLPALVDAGLLRDCTPRFLNCNALLSDEAANTLAKGVTDTQYVDLSIPVYDCGNNNLVFPPNFPLNKVLGKKLFDFDSSECKLSNCGDAGVCEKFDTKNPVVVDQPKCAWRPAGAAKNSCRKRDGGDPGDENTMQEGEFAGAGCIRKACVEISGFPSGPRSKDGGR